MNGVRVSREGNEDYKKFSAVFPDFLWLLRDVTLTPTDARGNETDARTFLIVSEKANEMLEIVRMNIDLCLTDGVF